MTLEKIENLNRAVKRDGVSNQTLSDKERPRTRLHWRILPNIKIRIKHQPPLRLFQKIEEEGRLSNSFYEANITIIPEPRNASQEEGYYRPVALMNMDVKILNKLTGTEFSRILKGLHTKTVVGLSQERKVGSTYKNQSL